MAFFAGRARLGADELYATVWLGPDAPCWSAEESLLVRAADELHERVHISDATWASLRACFDEAQLVEIVALAGLYRMVSYVVNATGVALEPDAPTFP